MTVILYVMTVVLPLATILIVFGMRYRADLQQARARLANDDAYRRLGESTAADLSHIAASVAAMEANVSELRSHMANIETVLKAVE